MKRVICPVCNSCCSKYGKTNAGIDIFLKQFPHLRHIVAGELKTKSSKNLFRKLN